MVSFRKLFKDCRPSKSRPIKDTEDVMRQRLVYRYENPDTTTPAIFSSYCPVISCSVLYSLRHREKEATSWLITRFVDQFGPGKKMDLLLLCDPRLLVCIHQIFTAELRLFEVYFGVSFAWSGFERQVVDGSCFPFDYNRPALDQHYRRECLSLVGAENCERCKGRRSQGCTTVVEHTIEACFPRRHTRALVSPDFHRFNNLQMAAWSLATSLGTVTALGAAVGSNSVLVWGSNLLNSWEWKLRDTMGSGDDVKGDFDAVCPKYFI